jgi:hypothetical protein
LRPPSFDPPSLGTAPTTVPTETATTAATPVVTTTETRSPTPAVTWPAVSSANGYGGDGQDSRFGWHSGSGDGH